MKRSELDIALDGSSRPVALAWDFEKMAISAGMESYGHVTSDTKLGLYIPPFQKLPNTCYSL